MTSYESWLTFAMRFPVASLSQDRLEAIWQYTARYGSGNSWAGTSGEGAEMIRELLLERAVLLNEMHDLRRIGSEYNDE
jgi:hypothetical protein